MKRQAGFTLLELIISTFLFGIIVIGVSAFFLYYFRNYSFSFAEQQTVGQTQAALTLMVREIRKARSSDDGAWALAQTDNNALTFYADVDGDGKTEKVRYFLSGTDLKRGITPQAGVPITYPAGSEKLTTLASNMQATGSGIFQYYNGSWPFDTVNNPLVSTQRLQGTRYIEITLQMSSPGSGTTPFQVSSGVSIRSIKDNL